MVVTWIHLPPVKADPPVFIPQRQVWYHEVKLANLFSILCRKMVYMGANVALESQLRAALQDEPVSGTITAGYAEGSAWADEAANAWSFWIVQATVRVRNM